MNQNKKRYYKGKSGKGQGKVVREQPKKDSDDKRVNLDNERVDKFQKHESTCNDPRWYLRSPEQLKAAGSIPFATGAGFQPPENMPYVPGVMSIVWAPDFGDVTAINQIKNAIFSYTIHKNGRNPGYDANDQFCMIIAGASVFAFLSWIVRAYGLMKNFSALDKYTPKALITAMGIDYQDLVDNLSNMWFDINQMIAQSRQIWIPNDLPFVERWYWLSANVYRDGTSAEAQYYMFNPHYFLEYGDVIDENGSAVIPLMTKADEAMNIKPAIDTADGTMQPVFIPGTVNFDSAIPDGNGNSVNPLAPNRSNYHLYKWAEIKSYFYGMMARLLNAGARGQVYADIYNAYGPEKIYSMPEITANYQVAPVYDQEVLTQIENCTPSATYFTALYSNMAANTLNKAYCASVTAFDVLTEDNVQAAISPSYLNGILNFHQKEQPTPEQVAVATRLKTGGTKTIASSTKNAMFALKVLPSTDPEYIEGGENRRLTFPTPTKNQEVPNSVGTERCCAVMVYTYHEPMSSPAETPTANRYDNAETLQLNAITRNYATVADANVITMAIFATFDWAPWIYIGVPSSWKAIMGDYDNYVYLDDESLRKLHLACVMSEMGVPFQI